MKKLNNYIVDGGLLRPNGDEAQIGDSVRLYLDNDVVVNGTIDFPIAKVNCGDSRAYTIEYDYESIIRSCEINDSIVIDDTVLLDERISVLETEIVPVNELFGDSTPQNLMQRAFEGLTVPFPFFVVSTHTSDQKLTLGFSRDGFDFTKFPVNYTPPIGDGVRDPSIIFHLGRYWVVYTAGSFGDKNYIGLAVSDNLLDWEHFLNIPTEVTDGGTFSWAPEWSRDGDTVYITYSKQHAGGIWRIHYVYNADGDFTSWFAGGEVTGISNSSEIDAQIIRFEHAWLMATRDYSDGDGPGLNIYKSTVSPVSGYALFSTLGGGAKEGCCFVNMGEGRLRLYFLNLPAANGHQSYVDSFDGGLTFGTRIEIEGTLDNPDHMTVVPFLDPQFADAEIQRPSPSELRNTYGLNMFVISPRVFGSSQNFDFNALGLFGVGNYHDSQDFILDMDVIISYAGHLIWKRLAMRISVGSGTIISNISIVSNVDEITDGAFSIATPSVVGNNLRFVLTTAITDAWASGVRFSFKARPMN